MSYVFRSTQRLKLYLQGEDVVLVGAVPFARGRLIDDPVAVDDKLVLDRLAGQERDLVDEAGCLGIKLHGDLLPVAECAGDKDCAVSGGRAAERMLLADDAVGLDAGHTLSADLGGLVRGLAHGLDELGHLDLEAGRLGGGGGGG